MASQWLCERGTPFGRPSVPEVQQMVRMSSASTAAAASSAAACSRAVAVACRGTPRTARPTAHRRRSPARAATGASAAAWRAGSVSLKRLTVRSARARVSFRIGSSSARRYCIGTGAQHDAEPRRGEVDRDVLDDVGTASPVRRRAAAPAPASARVVASTSSASSQVIEAVGSRRRAPCGSADRPREPAAARAPALAANRSKSRVPDQSPRAR